MVSLTEWATRRLIIVIVGTAAVTTVSGVAFGRYVVPATSDGDTSAQADPEPVSPQPATDTPVVVAPTDEATEEQPGTEGDSPLGSPSRINEFGVPVGYPHTEAGAISACGNYVSAYTNLRNREPSRIKNVIRSFSDEQTAERLGATIIDIDNQTAENFGVSSVHSPQFGQDYRLIGYHIDSYDENESTIAVLTTAGAGVFDGPQEFRPNVYWGVDYCIVEWTDGDWKLSDVRDGPDEPSIAERAASNFMSFVLSGVNQ